jgi:hypothetical protein
MNIMASVSSKESFYKIMLVYLFWSISWVLAGCLFEVYFFGLGATMQEIFFSNCFWFVAALLTIPFFRGFEARNFMLIGILFAILAVSTLIIFPFASAAPFYRLVLGITHFFFWVPFNTVFYEYKKENHATLGAVYYAVGPVLSLFAPAFAGYVAASFGFPLLYSVSILLFMVAFALTWLFIKNRRYEYNFDESLKSLYGLRSLIFIEGFAAAIIISVTLEVMLLLYIKTPLEFGGFISTVTLFAVIASIIMAKVSDRLGTRRNFLLPIVACFGISTIITSQSPDLAVFFIGVSLIQFFSRIFFPLPLALAVDNSKSLVNTMIGREFILNLGRLAGALLAYLVFIFTDIRVVLLLQGLALLIYVPLFEHKKKKLNMF